MAAVVEKHSIDVVPDSARHGRAFNQFTLWLGANLRSRPSSPARSPSSSAATWSGPSSASWPATCSAAPSLALHSAHAPKLGLAPDDPVGPSSG